MPSNEKCPNCGKPVDSRFVVSDYACPRCGRFLDQKFRKEHPDGPQTKRAMTIERIKAEYREAGQPLPGWTP